MPSAEPLNPVTPMDEPTLKHLRGNRDIYLWGASIVGFGMCRALERLDMAPAAFIDKSPRMVGTQAMGYPVLHPRNVLNNLETLRNAFIVITSGHYEDEIAKLCEGAELMDGVDFVRATELNSTDPSVDITGMCNLHCKSCPRGNFEDQGATGYMKPEIYNQVVDKLLGEIPFLGSIQLYAWGEPLLHPQVAEIISDTVTRKILCALSTNLNIKRDFEPAIAAQPDWLKVSASGFESSYSITHTGGNWDRFLRNLHRLKQYRAQLNPNMYIEVNYHLYNHTTPEEFENMASLCRELDFAFRPNWAYLYPLDLVMDYRLGKPLPAEADETLGRLLLTIDEGLARADEEAHLPCAEERCLPITWDGNVRSCGSYFVPHVAGKFLDTPLRELRKQRDDSKICERCKSQSLHRFTSTYVRECEPTTSPSPAPSPRQPDQNGTAPYAFRPSSPDDQGRGPSQGPDPRSDLIQIREVQNL